VPVSAEDLSGGVNDLETNALLYWLRVVAGPGQWWTCRPKDGSQGVGLETIATKEHPEVRPPSKEATRTEMKGAGVGSCAGV